jgi:hypothetical protein
MAWPKGLVRIHARETADEVRARVAAEEAERRTKLRLAAEEAAALRRERHAAQKAAKAAKQTEGERLTSLVVELMELGPRGVVQLDQAIDRAEQTLAFLRLCRVLFPAAHPVSNGAAAHAEHAEQEDPIYGKEER